VTGEPTEIAPSRTRRFFGRAWRLRSWVIGLLALPVSIAPFYAFVHYDGTGQLIALQVERQVSAPPAPHVPAAAAVAYRDRTLRYGGALVVLAFRSVLDAPHADRTDEGAALSTRRFGEDLAMLQAAGFNTVTPDQVRDWLAGLAPLPANAVLLTFDDGRKDVVLNAAPMLKRLHMHATMFAIGGAYGKSPLIEASDDDLRGLQHEGWSIEAHAVNGHDPVDVGAGKHLPFMAALRWLPTAKRLETIDEFRLRVRTELDASRAAAEAISRRPVVAYAWPFGAAGQDGRTNDHGIALVDREEGHRAFPLVFGDVPADTYVPATIATDPGAIGRLRVDPAWTADELWQRIQVAVIAAAPEVQGDA
jgi:peptidoglycan/xylan/chitin deacetylase (PgdA/CDA1 family)